MIELVLALHLAGAAFTVLFVLIGGVQIWLRRGNEKLSGVAAIFICVYQLLSGFALVLFSPNVSAKAVCIKGLLLVSLVVAVQIAVKRRLRTAEVISA